MYCMSGAEFFWITYNSPRIYANQIKKFRMQNKAYLTFVFKEFILSN